MLGLQTHGYDDFDDDSKNIAIWWSSVIKFYKKTTPSMVKSVSSQSEFTTLITHDYGMNFIAPQMIPRSALKPPTEWVTKWESIRKPTRPSPINSSTIFTTRYGNVHTIFPESRAEYGGPSVNISTSVNTIPTFSVDPIFVDTVKKLVLSEIASSSNPLATVCDHPHCSKTFCQFSSQPTNPHGNIEEDRKRINMITFVPKKSNSEEGYTSTRFFNIHEEIIIQSTQQNSH